MAATNIGTLEAVLKLRDEMSPAISAVSSGALGAVAGVLSFGAAVAATNEALMAQSEAEAAVNKLNLALANTGQFSEAASAGLRSFASGMQDTTTFSDEAVISVEALFASFGMGVEQIPEATRVVADFAAATGTELTTAANLLGKAFAGNTAALGRYGIVVSENLSRDEKYAAVMEQLNARFGGSAQNQILTYAGAMAQLKNQVGEVWEAAGRLLGAVFGVTDGISGAVPAVKGLIGFIGDLQIAFTEAKAMAFEFIAGLLDVSVKALELGQKIRTALGFKPDPNVAAFIQTVHDVADGQRQLAAETRESSNKLIEQGGHFAKVTNSATPFKRALEDTSEAQKKLVDSMEKFFDDAAKQRAIYDERNAAQEKYLEMLGPGAEKATTEMARLADVTEKLGGVGALTDAQLVSLVKQLQEQARLGGDDAEAFDTLAAAMEEAANRSDAVAEGVGLIVPGLKNMGDEAEAAARKAKEHAEALNAMGDAAFAVGDKIGDLGSLLQAFGVKADSGIGKALGTMQGLANTAGDVFKKIGSQDYVGAAIAGIKGLVGAIKGLFGGNKVIMEINDQRDLFMTMHNGYDGLVKDLAAVGKTGESARVLIAAIFDAKTPEAYAAAVNAVNDAIKAGEEATNKVKDAMERYGLTIDQMGPRFAQQQLDEQATQLLEDYRLLIAAGADNVAVLTAMAPKMNEYVNSAIASGATVPEAMRAQIEEMIRLGLLVDENGNAYGSAEEAGIHFAETVSEAVGRAADAIERLVEALTGVSNTHVPPIHIPVVTDQEPGAGHGSPPIPPGIPGFQHGTGGFRDFGAGTPAMLHGVEAVVPAGEGLGFDQAAFEAAIQRQTASIVRGVRDAVMMAK